METIMMLTITACTEVACLIARSPARRYRIRSIAHRMLMAKAFDTRK